MKSLKEPEKPVKDLQFVATMEQYGEFQRVINKLFAHVKRTQTHLHMQFYNDTSFPKAFMDQLLTAFPANGRDATGTMPMVAIIVASVNDDKSGETGAAFVIQTTTNDNDRRMVITFNNGVEFSVDDFMAFLTFIEYGVDNYPYEEVEKRNKEQGVKPTLH